MAVRRKKKGRAWKGFIAGMGLAGIFGLLLMWAVGGPSGAKIRDAFRSRMSVMVDRADQLVEALNRRALPGKPDQEETPALAPPASEPPSGRREPAPAPAPVSERPVLAPDQPAPPPPAAAMPPPPDNGITPDDQKQLRELMKKINQGR